MYCGREQKRCLGKKATGIRPEAGGRYSTREKHVHVRSAKWFLVFAFVIFFLFLFVFYYFINAKWF